MTTAKKIESSWERNRRLTETVLLRMFKENTGRHICDSGGYGGRMWERNQKKDLDAEPYCKVEFSVWPSRNAIWEGAKDKTPELEIMPTISAYHFCCEHLIYEEALDKSFQTWANQPHRLDVGWLALMQEWVEWKFKGEATSPWDSNDSDPAIINTYNEECMLSQSLQYAMFEVDGEQYYLLQIHGGCDIRGGYTAPRVFSCAGNSEWGLDSRKNDAALYCDNCDARWYSEYNGWDSDGTGVDFDDCEVVEDETEDQWNARPMLDENQLAISEDTKPQAVNEIHVFNGKASCPCCGKGVLS